MEKTKQQQKQLEDKDAKKAKAKEATHDAGMTKIAQSLTTQLRDVAWAFYAEVCSEALSVAGVKTDSDLRGANKVYYLPSTAPPPPNPSSTSYPPKPIATPASTTSAEKEKDRQLPSQVVQLGPEEVMEVEQLKRNKKEKEKETAA